MTAALGYARRGWPVFPCSPVNKRPLLPKDKDPVTGNPIKGSGGVSKATRDEEQIRAWWKRWPGALIGLATGHHSTNSDNGATGRRLFVVDFDPRVEEVADPESGEVTRTEWTLEQLKAELEAQMGCPLPTSLSARTPSGGVHVYLAEPDDGEAIRNRGNLPTHVDVRGLGGYVIAPPSVMAEGADKGQGGLGYRWLRGNWDAEIAASPAELVKILREPKGGPPKVASPSPPAPLPQRGEGRFDRGDAVRKYALTAMDEELRLVSAAAPGTRNQQLYDSSYALGTLIGAGALMREMVEPALQSIARGWPDYPKSGSTIDNGLTRGEANPRDLGDVATRAATPSRTRPPPRPAAAADDRQPFRSGSHAKQSPAAEGGDPLTEAERERFGRVARAWLAGRIERLTPASADPAEAKKAVLAVAWGAGRRVAAGLIDAGVAKEALWPAYEGLPDVSHADVDRAFDEGEARGFDIDPLQLTMRCASYPMTDFGIAERFRDRHGHDYRFTTAKGWLGWDGRRWKVLDQEKDVPPAEVIAAVFDTVRAIQDEARFVRQTGVEFVPVTPERKGKEAELDLGEESPHGLDRWIPKGKTFELLSTRIAIWGRQSETVGKPAAVANLARRWLTSSIEAFDVDPLALNVMNGTLRFRREILPDGSQRASVTLDPHDRGDLNTKLAPVDYDRDAPCPLYDGMIEWAQPDAAVRRYLHQWGGYSASGHTGEHKLHFWYGKGRNGKSTTIDIWSHVLGDYSGTIGVETFLDQGIKKRGEQASPDLARLGGVRLLRASEPERGAKLNEALIKAATGGEPMAVRALHRGFFDLQPRFKLTIGGNYRPDVPGTDEGIWARLKLVPWEKNIDLEFDDEGRPRKDPELLDKMKAREPSGILNRLVDGLLDWLANGLVEPEAVSAATQAYRDDSDPLARFLRLCTEPDASGRIQSSKLHEVFVAWCKAAGEREWSQKGLSKAMADKGFKKKASDGMQWLGIRLVRDAGDFVDADGRVRETLPEYEREAEGSSPAPPRPPPTWDDDDDVP